jgi:hypothetical protein
MRQPVEEDDEILAVMPSGTVITEKVAEEMAEEFERDGLDFSNCMIRYVDYPGLGVDRGRPRSALPTLSN